MDNDSRGLLFFIIGFTAIWLVFDNFYGKKYISNFVNLITPNIGSMLPSVNTTPTWKNPDSLNPNPTNPNTSDPLSRGNLPKGTPNEA